MTGKDDSIRKRKEILVVAAVLLLLSVFLFHKSITRFPSHVHAWTQSDRYALAIGFLENGFDFFHPATLNLQPKYPPSIPLDPPEGITSVDFPLVEYLAAGLMWLTGIHQPWIFRVLVWLMALFGLLAWYSSLRKTGIPIVFAALMTLVALLSPVHLYYFNGFIPSVPALALAFVSWWYYVSYLQQKRFRDYTFAVAALTLSALIRSPFLLPLLAMSAVQLFVNLKDKSLLRREMLASFAGVSAILGYRIYNDYLSTVYGSMFISSLMPASSPEVLLTLLYQSWNNWKTAYFSLPQYIILAVGLGLSITTALRRSHRPATQLLAFAALYLLASVLYFIAMAQQYPAHDYYFLDSFFMPLLLLASVGFVAVKLPKRRMHIISAIAVAGLFAWMLLLAKQAIESRYAYKSWDRAEMTRLNFEGGAALLDKAGIGAEEKLVVLDAYTSNTALLLLDRKGYAVINTSRQNMAEALAKEANFVAIQNRFLFSDVLRNMPELKAVLSPVANNGRIGIYGKKPGTQVLENLELLGLDRQQLMMQRKPTAGDTLADGFWCLQEGQQYLPLLDTTIEQPWQNSVLYFQSKARVVSAEEAAFSLVLDISGEDGFHYYDSFPFAAFFEHQQLETDLAVVMNLPATSAKKTRIKCYLYNPKVYYLCFKNLTFNRFDYNNVLLNNSLQNNEKH